MDIELEKYHKSNTELDQMINQLRLELDKLQEEILTESIKRQEVESLIKTIQKDISETTELIQHPKELKECVEIMNEVKL